MFDFNIKNDIYRVKDVFKIGWYLFAGYRKYIIILTFVGVLGGFAGAIGVNAIIPLFSFFVDGGNASAGTDTISRFIKETFLYFGIPFTLPFVLILISALFVFKALLLYLFDYIKIHIKTKYQQDMMNKVFKQSLYADWSYLRKQKIGYLETVIKTDVAISTRIMDILSNLLMMFTSLIMYTAVALNISQTITVMTLGIGAVLFVILKPLLLLTGRYAKQMEVLNKKVAQHINEHVGGMKTVKVNGIEGEVGMLGGELFERFRFLQIRTFLTKRIATIITEPVGIVFISVIVAFAYYKTAYNIGALIAVIYLIKQIFSYIQSMLGGIHLLGESVPYAKEVLQYQKLAEKFQEKKQQTGEDLFSFDSSIDFENVKFEYEDGKRALHGLSFKIKKGEMIGFVGPSGGGKSTIFDLLLRLFEPSEGQISIDGKNIKNISIKDWRKNISYVPQDMFLLNDTIKENIRFRNKDVSDKDIVEATKSAHIYDFIMSLPDGFDTVVGERGMMLSGGQRQRVVIARALARKPKLLLLDEATSALDKESENAIKEALDEKKGEITILTIAHRISTIREADRIFVIKDGKIVEQGSPKELLKKKDTYFSKVHNMEN